MILKSLFSPSFGLPFAFLKFDGEQPRMVPNSVRIGVCDLFRQSSFVRTCSIDSSESQWVCAIPQKFLRLLGEVLVFG